MATKQGGGEGAVIFLKKWLLKDPYMLDWLFKYSKATEKFKPAAWIARQSKDYRSMILKNTTTVLNVYSYCVSFQQQHEKSKAQTKPRGPRNYSQSSWLCILHFHVLNNQKQRISFKRQQAQTKQPKKEDKRSHLPKEWLRKDLPI